MTRTHSLPRDAGAKNRPPKAKGGPRLGSVDKDWCCHELDSMTATLFEHEIATFPGSADMASHAYSTVHTRTPSAVPSSSNFPASHLDSEPGLMTAKIRPGRPAPTTGGPGR